MASNMIRLSREHVGNQSTPWLESAISPHGRACATGWHERGYYGGRSLVAGRLTVRGALAIALIRTELKRRAIPAPGVPYVETDLETAYGSTVRLSRSVRVF